MRQQTIDNQIANVVKEIMKATNVDMWNHSVLEKYFTKKIGEIYCRGYNDGVIAK